MTTLRSGSATDVGLVRANNQDQALLASPLFAVADGMGGHAAGEVASEVACQALAEAFTTGPSTAEALVEAAQEANRAVFDRAQANPEMHGMGTTLVAVALITSDGQPCLAVAHVGDSRVYLVRDGEIRQVTADHSLVAELVAEGQIAAEEAERHPQRHVLSRALGVYPDVDVDLALVNPSDGDRLLLCSDGLSREVSDNQIASVLRRLADPDEAARQLIEEAKAKGGADNITVVIVDVTGDGAVDDTRASPSDEPTRVSGLVIPHHGGLDDVTGSDTGVDATRAVPAGVGAAAPPAEGGDSREQRRQRRRATKAARGPRSRLVTVRSVAFLIALLAVAAIAVGGIDWYARSSYYVGLSGNSLVVFQGRPGGVLWIQPTVADRTGVTTAQIEPRHLSELNAGKTETSLAAARQYVANLRAEEQAARAAGSATTNPGAPNGGAPVTGPPIP